MKKWLSIAVFSLAIISIIAVSASCRDAPKHVDVVATDSSSLTPVNNQASGVITIQSLSGGDVGKAKYTIDLELRIEFYDLAGKLISTDDVIAAQIPADATQDWMGRPIAWKSNALASDLRPARYTVEWSATTQAY